MKDTHYLFPGNINKHVLEEIQLLELPQTCPTLSRSGDPCVMVLANVMVLAHVMVLAGRGR